MAVTKSWEQAAFVKLTADARTRPGNALQRIFLAGASLLVVWGLLLTYWGKTQSFVVLKKKLDHGELLNLNRVETPDQIAPFLQNSQDPVERGLAAGRVFEFLRSAGPIPNVGALARLRIDTSEIAGDLRWTELGARLRARAEKQTAVGVSHGPIRLPLIPVGKLKPLFIVRTPGEFNRELLLWCGVYVASFWIVHLVWCMRRFEGDWAILPGLHLLTGMGLILAVSLRDPLRDTLDFKKFAWGAALGCGLLLLPLLRAFQFRHFSRWIYTPLIASLALFGLLLAKGSGPSGSDAKVNLGPFQPVEIIKILLVLFLAGYFTRRWEWLRELRERTLVPPWLRWPELPRLAHVVPVVAGVAIALAFFFLLKDMGPALVIGFLFLAMFALARGRVGLAVLGIALLVGGVALGYRLGVPHTVVDRIQMWLSPWDNDVRGGDQIAHALWAFSTGGTWGSGPGWGDPGMIPAGHTDLVLPSIGEEWGFCGVLAVFLLFALLVWRAFRIAVHAPEEYPSFLAFGLGALVALEMLLISAGALDAIPLSGVVSPFLSSGNTAMLANFLIFAMLLAISNQSRGTRDKEARRFRKPIRITGCVFALLGTSLLARAAYFQIASDREFIIHDAKVFAEDGVKRAQHNPRLNSLMRQIPRGDILDRNGVILATGEWAHLEERKAEYQRLGVDIDRVCSRLDTRHYPFGDLTQQFLGDLRTGEEFHATNSSLIEHDSNVRLQGYRNTDELAPALRYRHYPDDPHMRLLLDRPRNVKTSIDVRLQARIRDTVERRMDAGGQKGAVIVMDVASGDVLALVDAPHPSPARANTPDQLLDRARYGQYAPGSTFKLVTAMAALRRDPQATRRIYSCVRLPDGRVGARIPGWNRPIRDDVKDHAHGAIDMMQAITISCNAYFAQLGVSAVGAPELRRTAELLEIPTGDAVEFQHMLPFSSYGQGPVVTTPFKLARVAATIAAGGTMPQGRWVIDDSNSRVDVPRPLISADSARFLQQAMRSVVMHGTGRSAMAGLEIPIGGKTGTAQVQEGEPHSWFAGFAPYGDTGGRQIAFAVVVEHGGYGGKAAAPVAREVVEAARDLGIIGVQTR